MMAFFFFFFLFGDDAMDFFNEDDEGKALEESLRLWPDPTDAPDVPVDRALLEFHRNPQRVQPEGLALQIRESVNCRRAIDRLLIRRGVHPVQELSVWPSDDKAANETLSAETTNKLRAIFQKYPRHQSGQEGITAQRGAQEIPTEIMPGQFWNTASECEYWDRRAKTMRKRWTFLPMEVLIVSGPETTEWGDEICQVVPCTDALLWRKEPSAGKDVAVTTDTGEEYIAHLWLVCMMSRSQLSGLIGTAHGNTVFAGIRHPAISKFDMQIDHASWKTAVKMNLDALKQQTAADLAENRLEAERLTHRAAYLWLTARSRYLKWESTK
jgi:hypothetical protein